MSKRVCTKFAMAMVLALVCVGFASCGGSDVSEPASTPAGSETNEGGSQSKAVAPEKPATDKTADTTTAAPEETPKATDELEKEPAAAAGGDLSAETLPGTVWSAGALNIAFHEDGKLMVNDASEGTWKLEGDSLTVAAMGMEITAQIEGDKIMYNGSPVERVQ